MPTVYKTTKDYSLTSNNASQVTISDSLYNFIQAQNQNIVTFETINQNYKPRIPNIPMVNNLRVQAKARNGYNQNVTRLNKEHSDKKELLTIQDQLFKPYTTIKQATEKYHVLEEDTRTNFKGCYWTGLNPENLINHVSNYNIYKRYPSLAYGVSDNATQVFHHLHQALKTYLTKDSTHAFFSRGKRLYKSLTTHPDTKYLIRFAPIINQHDGELGGWRWHKSIATH